MHAHFSFPMITSAFLMLLGMGIGYFIRWVHEKF